MPLQVAWENVDKGGANSWHSARFSLNSFVEMWQCHRSAPNHLRVGLVIANCHAKNQRPQGMLKICPVTLLAAAVTEKPSPFLLLFVAERRAGSLHVKSSRQAYTDGNTLIRRVVHPIFGRFSRPDPYRNNQRLTGIYVNTTVVTNALLLLGMPIP